MIVPNRRRFLVGAVASLLAAPSIVRATSLMPVKSLDVVKAAALPIDTELNDYLAQYRSFQTEFLRQYRTLGNQWVNEFERAKSAKALDVTSFARNWSGARVETLPTYGRADKDDGAGTLRFYKQHYGLSL